MAVAAPAILVFQPGINSERRNIVFLPSSENIFGLTTIRSGLCGSNGLCSNELAASGRQSIISQRRVVFPLPNAGSTHGAEPDFQPLNVREFPDARITPSPTVEQRACGPGAVLSVHSLL
jgi:hypothetical protein